jgi:alkylation response protein AidB-like acyl-CoA dehydrogenase
MSAAHDSVETRGGGFLLAETDPGQVFTPEDLTEEQQMIADLTVQFVEREVLPHDDRIEHHRDWELTVQLLRKAGEAGLLGAEVPEAYGGSDLDKISSTLITEHMVKASSFALSHGAHVGIGSLPIVLFGSEEQKQRYLPDLASGARLAAYCLTEPSSGSDALGARTKAVLNAEGTHYMLNGQKQFITNAAFADVFIVYAKVDGDKFTAFILERDYPGLSTGPEESKMGIKGSSTRPLILEDVPVPVENVLGEIGRGHVIAFNILNIGRYKLAAGCVGTSKWAAELAIEYGLTRKQFGKRLVNFPLIRKKIADMTIRTFVCESMVYRTGGLIDRAMQALDKAAADYSRQAAKAIEEYALECSINKVFATEALDFVADEGLQIHGGYGFIQEYTIERINRDARINRIFEGTNEINRLLIPGTLLKRALKGQLPLMEAAQSLQQELIAYMPPLEEDDEALAQEGRMIDAAKKLFLMTGGTAVNRYGLALEEEQEVLESLANLIIEIYAMESVCLRTRKLLSSAQSGTAGGEGDRAAQAAAMATVYIHEAFARIGETARNALAAMEEGDMLQMQLSIVRKLTRCKPVNIVELKRSIAAAVIPD